MRAFVLFFGLDRDDVEYIRKESEMSDWSQFLSWAKRLTEDVDLDAEERKYKLAAADRWKSAIEACRAEGENWPDALRRAAGAGNLVDPFAQTGLPKIMSTRRAETGV